MKHEKHLVKAEKLAARRTSPGNPGTVESGKTRTFYEARKAPGQSRKARSTPHVSGKAGGS